MHSQTSSTPRVQTLVNSKGDTLVQMSLVDAKVLLTDLLSKAYSDSLVAEYEKRDSIQHNTIILQKAELDLMKVKFDNQKTISENLEQVLANKDKEIKDLNDVIKKQKKEIRKQKALKIVGFVAAVVLPITTFLFMVK